MDIEERKKTKVGGHIRPRPNKENPIYYDVIVHLGKDKITGKRKTVTFKAYTKEDAENLLIIKQAEYLNNEMLMPNKLLVKDYIEEYYENYVVPQVSDPTIRDYHYIYNSYIIPEFGSIPLQKLTSLHVQKVYNKWRKCSPLSKNPLASATIHHINRVFKVALERAVELEYIKKNPTKGVKIGKDKEKKQLEVLTKEEIHELQQAVKGTDMELPVALLFDCVMRRGELLGLRYQDINFETKTVTIQHALVETVNNKVTELKSCKTDSSYRKIVVSDYTMNLLKKQRAIYKRNKMKYGEKFVDSNHVVCQENGKPFLPKSFTRKWARTLEKHELRHIKLHGTRHSAISLFLSMGIPLHMVQARAGHQSPEITLSVYSHVAKDDADLVANRLETEVFQRMSS